MHKITIMGTSEKLGEIKNETNVKVVLRTEISKAFKILKNRGVDFATLDDVYDDASDFEQLDSLLAKAVIDMAAGSEILYVVPGSAVVGDGSVREIAKHYDNLEIIAGMPMEYDLLKSISDLDASCGYTVIPAACLKEGLFSPRLPLIITALDNEFLLSDVKLLLSSEYDDGQIVYIGQSGVYEKLKLYEIDRYKQVSHETMLYVPPKDSRARYDYFELEGVFEKLRSPDGCPWDREQDHVSLKRYLLEECAEVLDAIDGGDMAELMDELGDVLLQVLFHATIASERGDFDMRDVVDNLTRKLIKRHPHVFGDATADDPDAVLKQWDAIKAQDKDDKTVTASLKEVPKSMTALMHAQKVLSRAAKSDLFPGSDNDESEIVEKIERLTDEIKVLHKKDTARAKDLIGVLLFEIAKLARALETEGELLLKDATKEYIKQFEEMELGGK